MTDYITSFLLPTLSVLTASFVIIGVWFMISHKKHEEKSSDRHAETMQYNRTMSETLKKVDKHISEDVVPKLGEIFNEKSGDFIPLTPEGVASAIEKIGASPTSISDDGELMLVGWIHEEQKVYFLISIDTEAKDIMVEGYSNTIDNIDSDMATFLLKYNEEMKVSGVCLEEIGGKTLIKTQQMLDAPDSKIHLRTFDFILNSLMDSQVKIQRELTERKIKYEFFPPEDYFPLRFDAKVPNKEIQPTT